MAWSKFKTTTATERNSLAVQWLGLAPSLPWPRFKAVQHGGKRETNSKKIGNPAQEDEKILDCINNKRSGN